MKKIKILTFLFIFSLVTYAWSVNKDLQTISDLTSKKGILSIEEIQENKLYRLKGEWEYYPNVFLNDNDTLDDKLVHNYQTIEHNWSTDKTFNNGFGYASYRLVLKGLDPNIQYGLLLERAGSSYQLYVNNNLTLSNGKIAKSETDSISENFTDKAVFKSDLNGNAEIIVEISNYVKVNSGFDFAPLFGTYDDILNFYETSMIVELFVFSSMFTMSILFFLIAIIIKDRRSFFMAVLTLLFAMRVISTGNHMIYVLNPYIDLSLIWILRIEYISVFLMLPIFVLLANTFTIFELKKKYLFIPYMMIVVFSISSILLNHAGLHSLYFAFQFLIAMFGVYYFYCCYAAYKKNHLDANSILLILIYMASALVSNYFFQGTRYSFYFMTMIFTLFIAATVIYRFSIINERTVHLESIVKIDPLTKLWNRTYLNDLSFELGKNDTNQTIFVLFIDLNGFKQINDEYGHKVGDEVLRIAARRLRNSCHESDKIIRIGGDEFLVIAHMKDANSIEKVIKRIRDNFIDPFSIEDIVINLSLAIGYHQYNPNTDDLETIIAMSDKKMYEDKRKQTNL